MKTYIERLDGTVYDLEALGITTQDFNPASPSPIHNYERVTGRDGAVDLGTTYDIRIINGTFYAKAEGLEDYAQKRNEVFRLFRSKEAFYLTESRVQKKTWFVKVESEFRLDQQWKYGFFEIQFIAFNPYSEGMYSTQDPLLLTDGQPLFPDGFLTSPAHPVQYTFTNQSTVWVYNAGDKEIDPRSLPLTIELTGAFGTYVQVENLTNGTHMKYNKTMTASDILLLDGVKVKKNSLNSFRDTDRTLLSLDEGWNEIQITAGTMPANYTIKFDFKFYYL